MSDTRKVVEGYFKGWTTNDVDAAYALLDPKLVFRGPTATRLIVSSAEPAG